ncbi:MAG: hypothetical protein AB7E95_10430 [Kiritimatiellales bacterium]
MKFLKHSFSAALLVFLAGCGRPTLPPDGFAAQAVLNTDTLRVGDPVTLTLTVRHPEGAVIRFPDLGNGKQVVVRGRAHSTKKLSDTVVETEELYHLTSFRIGDWNLTTTNAVICTFTDGSEKHQALPKLILHVQSSLNSTNATKVADIKGIVKPPLKIKPILWVSLIIAALAIIAGLLTLAFLRKPRTILQMPPPEPPHILARRALDALKNKEWLAEPFFTELSLILRTYLEKRFELNAPDSTTEELTRMMSKDIRLNLSEQQSLRNFMTQSDLVKFARADAEKEVMQNAYSTVEQFVEQTTPADKEVEE